MCVSLFCSVPRKGACVRAAREKVRAAAGACWGNGSASSAAVQSYRKRASGSVTYRSGKTSRVLQEKGNKGRKKKKEARSVRLPGTTSFTHAYHIISLPSLGTAWKWRENREG